MVINNAALVGDGPVEALPIEVVQSLCETNVFDPLRVMPLNAEMYSQEGVVSMSETKTRSFTAVALPHLRKVMLLPGCGYWVQQERPAEVNAELINFLRNEIER